MPCVALLAGSTSDAGSRRGEYEPMVETMSCRGPDDEGLWVSAHAALGHRRLAIIDVPGGHQPMTLDGPDGDADLVIVYCGEVYNFTELREELPGTGPPVPHRFATPRSCCAASASGARTSSRASTACSRSRSGTPGAEELFLVRDRMGVKPLSYYPTPDGVLFGSEPKAILAHPRAEAVVDLDGLRELLAHRQDAGARLLPRDARGPARRAACASAARASTNGATGSSRRIEHTDDRDTTVAHVRALLDDIVARQTVSDVPLCSLLSGGLDSSIITALAAQKLRADGDGPVRSFSVDFVGYEDAFNADPMRDTPDGPYVRELAEYVAAQHEAIVLSTDDLIDADARAAVLRARDVPAALGDMDTSLYLLFKAIRGRSTVALSGESADEVFGGYRWFHEPEAVDADTFPGWPGARQGPLGEHAALYDEDLRSRSTCPATSTPRTARRCRRCRTSPGRLRAGAADAGVCYLHLTRFVQMLLDRKDRMSMASGPRGSRPVLRPPSGASTCSTPRGR